MKREPRWILSDWWGVDCDKYCWFLTPRALNKKGGFGGWNTDRRSYYANLGQLFESLQRKIERKAESGVDLIEWVEASYDTVEALSDRLIAKLKAEGLYDIKRPAKLSGDENE